MDGSLARDLTPEHGDDPFRVPMSETDQLAALFRALSDPNRIEILAILMAAPSRIADLETVLGTPREELMHHLRVLHDADLINATAEESGATYYLRRHATTLLELASELSARKINRRV